MNDETVNISTLAPGRLGPMLLSASTISGDDVYNRQGEKLGSIKDLMMGHPQRPRLLRGTVLRWLPELG